MRCPKKASLKAETCQFIGDCPSLIASVVQVGRGEGVAYVDHDRMGLAVPSAGLEDDIVSNAITYG